MPAWIESDAVCTGMSTTYINRQCCGSDCSSLNQVLKVAETDGEKMVNAVCGNDAVKPVAQSLAAYKASGAATIAEFDDTGWKFNTDNGIVHDYLMMYHPEWLTPLVGESVAQLTYIGGSPYVLRLTYSDLKTLRLRICDVVGTPSDILVNIYTRGTSGPSIPGSTIGWYEEKADFGASGLNVMGDGCLDMVVPVSGPVSGSEHPNTMSNSLSITDGSKRLQGVALTVNTAHASPVSFRLESMQLNEYLVTYGV